ncbi:hypothetical protein DERP_001591 [Dermatophagoides pteronyssinus]|uniref:Uncharacterized protein n=1 Tax=Dermatophagoides pteronyssinus TaxID=6956 RepID=A0ABQ8JBF5_DERPT|nr:hypothetical protein DERP_001591 [Dermatophagoides pteronyssinus]
MYCILAYNNLMLVLNTLSTNIPDHYDHHQFNNNLNNGFLLKNKRQKQQRRRQTKWTKNYKQ